VVHAGIYVEHMENLIPAGATNFAGATTVMAASGDTVTIQPNTGNRVYGETTTDNNKEWIIIQDLIMDGINVTNGDLENVKITSGAKHIRVTGGENKNAQAHGFLITTNGADVGNEVIGVDIHDWAQGTPAFAPHGVYNQSTGTIVDGNTIHDIGLSDNGWAHHGFDADIDGSIIRNNIIYEGATSGTMDGILVNQSAAAVEIYNNLIYELTGRGIGICRGAATTASVKIYNNTVDACAGGGIWVSKDNSAATDTEIKNNIVSNGTGIDGFGIRIAGANASDTVCDSNILFNNAAGNFSDSGTNTTNTNEINTDPDYVDAASDNYDILTTSPAKDVGLDLSGVFTTDINGSSRPAGEWDIGAFEFGAAIVIPPTVIGFIS